MNSLLLNFVIALWVTAITTACIGIFVYWQNPKNKLNKIFAFYSWSIGWWSFCQIWLIACDNRITALIWTRIEQIGVFFIPTFFIHFVVTFLGMKNRRFLIRFCYGLSIFFAMLCPTRHMMANAVPKFYVKHFATPGIVYPFAVFFFFIAVVYGLYELFRAYQQSVGARRNQLTYLFWGSLLGYVGGGANFALVFGINIPFLNPFGTYALAIYVTAVAYAIVRHQLMEIEVLVKKTLIFASLFTIILGIFIGITIVTQELIAGGRLLGLVISSIVIILTVRPLEDLLVRVTDKYLFQKKYDYKQVLKSFIDEVITVLSLDRIIESTIELLDKTLHPDTSDMLLFNKYEDKYVSYKALAHNEVLTIDNSAQMVTFLKSTKDTLSIESSGATAISATLKKEMEDLKARLAIPLMLHDDLIGIMLLGKKKSDEEYNKEDLDILTDLARTEAVAIGNAQLFAETAQNERRAAIGTLAAGINHEIGNPLNIINTKMQVYLMSIDRGLYKGKKPEDVIDESKGIMKTCLQQTSRISDITKKLSNFARPSKEFKPELIDVEEQIEETLSVLGHELELERIEMKKTIQGSLPKILGDTRQIQQVFFNLIKNAAQAIKERGIIEIKAYASGEEIKIDVSDAGHGISEDKLKKIYDPFFTTKEPGKGTGLGLSIVRQLVWRNKGDIKVKSEIGKGTTFTLTFPAMREKA